MMWLQHNIIISAEMGSSLVFQTRLFRYTETPSSPILIFIA